MDKTLKTINGYNHCAVKFAAQHFNLGAYEQYVRDFAVLLPPQARILDLGCGTAKDYINLLELYPDIDYTGIDPDKRACWEAKDNLYSANAKVITADACALNGQFSQKFDIVTSFSVFEHIKNRQAFIQFAYDCLKPGGYFLINYDNGHALHWQEAHLRLMRKCFFVKDYDFTELTQNAGFTIIDNKFFNSLGLKGIIHITPDGTKETYMIKWLDYEIWLNTIGMEYDDSMAKYFRTRNFILQKS